MPVKGFRRQAGVSLYRWVAMRLLQKRLTTTVTCSPSDHHLQSLPNHHEENANDVSGEIITVTSCGVTSDVSNKAEIRLVSEVGKENKNKIIANDDTDIFPREVDENESSSSSCDYNRQRSQSEKDYVSSFKEDSSPYSPPSSMNGLGSMNSSMPSVYAVSKISSRKNSSEFYCEVESLNSDLTGNKVDMVVAGEESDEYRKSVSLEYDDSGDHHREHIPANVIVHRRESNISLSLYDVAYEQPKTNRIEFTRVTPETLSTSSFNKRKFFSHHVVSIQCDPVEEKIGHQKQNNIIIGRNQHSSLASVFGKNRMTSSSERRCNSVGTLYGNELKVIRSRFKKKFFNIINGCNNEVQITSDNTNNVKTRQKFKKRFRKEKRTKESSKKIMKDKGTVVKDRVESKWSNNRIEALSENYFKEFKNSKNLNPNINVSNEVQSEKNRSSSSNSESNWSPHWKPLSPSPVSSDGIHRGGKNSSYDLSNTPTDNCEDSNKMTSPPTRSPPVSRVTSGGSLRKGYMPQIGFVKDDYYYYHDVVEDRRNRKRERNLAFYCCPCLFSLKPKPTPKRKSSERHGGGHRHDRDFSSERRTHRHTRRQRHSSRSPSSDAAAASSRRRRRHHHRQRVHYRDSYNNSHYTLL
ncbi:hypothetical protein Avbf_00500 [Armadillidium vulgare]|nr:hypothetical protein Avbf_00500 [Armadillidium vulgare]